jgi:hypothetical protein
MGVKISCSPDLPRAWNSAADPSYQLPDLPGPILNTTAVSDDLSTAPPRCPVGRDRSNPLWSGNESFSERRTDLKLTSRRSGRPWVAGTRLSAFQLIRRDATALTVRRLSTSIRATPRNSLALSATSDSEGLSRATRLRYRLQAPRMIRKIGLDQSCCFSTSTIRVVSDSSQKRTVVPAAPPLSLPKQLFNVTLGVKYRDHGERVLVNAIHDQVGQNRPKAKLRARREIFPPVSLSRRFDKRTKCRYDRRNHVPCSPEAAFIENVVSNLSKIALGLYSEDITAHTARRLRSNSSNSASNPAENASPSSTSPRSDCRNPRSILTRRSS